MQLGPYTKSCEHRGEEHEEDDDGRPPTQETEKDRQSNASEDDCEKEIDDAEEQFPRGSHGFRFQLVEMQNGEEKGDETDENAAKLGHSKHVSFIFTEISSKYLVNFFNGGWAILESLDSLIDCFIDSLTLFETEGVIIIIIIIR